MRQIVEAERVMVKRRVRNAMSSSFQVEFSIPIN